MQLASSDHIHSCFNIRSEGGQGTAFLFGTGKDCFFVTAKHVLAGATAGGSILFRKNQEWQPYSLTMVTHHSAGQDLSAFAVSGLAPIILHKFSHPDDPKIFAGQELKFTGFPHGLENTIDSPLGFSAPLVRTAFLSGLIRDLKKGTTLLVLDGLNNPGYSGGPVWAPGPTLDSPTLLGIISGYRVELKSKSGVFRDMKDGLEEKVEGLFVKPNSGMIHAVPFSDLAELADQMVIYNSL